MSSVTHVRASVISLAPKAVRDFAESCPTATHWVGTITGTQKLWRVQLLDREAFVPQEKAIAETTLKLGGEGEE